MITKGKNDHEEHEEKKRKHEGNIGDKKREKIDREGHQILKEDYEEHEGKD